MPRPVRAQPKALLLRKLGARVRELRTMKGLSQEALADACHFDRSYTSSLERGVRNPGLLNLARLAKVLGVKLSELLNGLD